MSLVTASLAPASVRYAAPGGTGKDPCASPADPCSVYTAAEMGVRGTTLRAGDVVELAPGTYHADDEAEFGELGSIRPPEGVTVRGEPGKPRPVIVVRARTTGGETFSVGPGVEVADVEVRNLSGQDTAIDVWGGTLTRVIARDTSSDYTCNFDRGTIRDSACINSGGGTAIGDNVWFTKPGTYLGVIRNSTLVATGPGSVGMDVLYEASKPAMGVIDAVGVLVRGEEKDVIAGGTQDKRGGAVTTIELQDSDYATVETKSSLPGMVSVTPPGTNGNTTALPLLAAGNLHQLPESPTVDSGAVDAASGSLDVDREPRTIGAAPDIGADELGGSAPSVNPVPVTQLGERPAKRSWKRRVQFTFGSSELGSRYECRLDGNPFRVCASPFKRKVRLGEHRLEVRAVDPQGQTDRSPAIFRWRVVPLRALLP